MVQQRRLRAELRRARDEAGRTQKDVATALGWSTSKVIRIETGAVAVSTSDVMALLHYYGINDERADTLLAVTRAKEEAWWDSYRTVFGQQFLNLLAYEDSSSCIRQFQSLVVPGLLQTPDYARAVITAYGVEPATAEMGIKVRLRRQELLTSDRCPQILVVLDENAIHRRVGGPAVMRDQLRRLKELGEHPRISIQVLPFSSGVLPAMKASFTIFEFPEDEDEHVVNLEDPHNWALIRDDAEITSRYLESFDVLQEAARPAAELGAALDPLIESLDREASH
ncbi:transcriptional regulator with XRE-family HTH domain [Kutzneria viridogrisea]|uniref:Transcriptional regulator with XRE-family HTH domain n=1 Tax=Kutzneria viridogrisea TaxID=47990 RepID=A0ABR6BLL7_9PSEU|nr:helix-turn-helix transcriptional regulator [Kutzneria albida]MBA8927768.1 transcriptional regulator with XRE-family HTH domain [Kutzneria viridogrisea]